MDIGLVVGTVVATRKDESLAGKKLLLTQPLDLDGLPVGPARLMVDAAGAGVGEKVIFVTGAASRNALKAPGAALDMAIVGIVDSCEVSVDVKALEAGRGRQVPGT
ncbi:MAG: EutN/CcmL family microcompartment protein [Deltaproteobacteria bacterium]|jgi:ethanolamine utilization protein EutN|nr:EutN/CcmL family microcompartment protein [Deltaproteobacteria bacterium]